MTVFLKGFAPAKRVSISPDPDPRIYLYAERAQSANHEINKEVTAHVSNLGDKTWQKREKSWWTQLSKPDGNNASCTLHAELNPEYSGAEPCGSRGKHPEGDKSSTEQKK